MARITPAHILSARTQAHGHGCPEGWSRAQEDEENVGIGSARGLCNRASRWFLIIKKQQNVKCQEKEVGQRLPDVSHSPSRQLGVICITSDCCRRGRLFDCPDSLDLRAGVLRSG